MPVQERDVIEAHSLIQRMKQLLADADPGMGSFWKDCGPRHWSAESERGQKFAELGQEYEALCSSMMVQSGRR